MNSPKMDTISEPVKKVIEEAKSRGRRVREEPDSYNKEAGHDYWSDEPRHEHHRDQG